MSHNKKTITIITAVVLVLALVIGWCAWRKHVTSTKETQASANTSSSNSTNKAKKKKTPILSDKQKEQNKTIALQMEKTCAIGEWTRSQTHTSGPNSQPTKYWPH